MNFVCLPAPLLDRLPVGVGRPRRLHSSARTRRCAAVVLEADVALRTWSRLQAVVCGVVLTSAKSSETEKKYFFKKK